MISAPAARTRVPASPSQRRGQGATRKTPIRASVARSYAANCMAPVKRTMHFERAAQSVVFRRSRPKPDYNVMGLQETGSVSQREQPRQRETAGSEHGPDAWSRASYY